MSGHGLMWGRYWSLLSADGLARTGLACGVEQGEEDIGEDSNVFMRVDGLRREFLSLGCRGSEYLTLVGFVISSSSWRRLGLRRQR